MDFDDDVDGAVNDIDLGLVPKKQMHQQNVAAGRRRGGDEPAGARPPAPFSGGWDGQPTMPVAPRNPVPPPPLTQAPSFKGTSLDEHASAPAPALAPAPPPSVPGPHPPAAGPRRPRQQQQGFVTAAEERNKKRHEELEQESAAMEIPELDGDHRDMTQEVAAPSKLSKPDRVQSFRELESGSGGSLDTWSTARGNVDLTLLTEVMCPAAQVEEADERWDHELLLNKIMHDVTLEKEELERQASGVAAAAT